MKIFIGGDQQPLLRGILRALVMRTRFPGDNVQYFLHDADVLGRNSSEKMHLVAHYGKGWASWTNTFPWTPRIYAAGQRNIDTLARRGIEPAHLKLEGSGAGKLIAAATLSSVILQGLLREVEWAVKLGGCRHKANDLSSFLRRLEDCSLFFAVQAISNFILNSDGLPLIEILSAKEFLSGRLLLEEFSHKLPVDWRWKAEERGSALPKAKYLAAELCLRGQMFCTKLSYWQEVEALAQELELRITQPLSIIFDVDPSFGIKDVALEFTRLHNPEFENAWKAYWRSKPSLLWLFLTGNLHNAVETAVVE